VRNACRMQKSLLVPVWLVGMSALIQSSSVMEVNKRFTIVALGDSTTAGTPGFLSPLEAPPNGRGNVESQYGYWLSRMHPDWQVLNRGINGERSDQIRGRFERDVVQSGASVVIIIAGVNDIYRGRSAESVIGNLKWMYGRARSRGILVVAGSILPYNTATREQNEKMKTVNAWVCHLAENNLGVRFCDTRQSVAHPKDPNQLMDSPDGLHPGVDGYRKMAEALAPILETIAREAAARDHR